MSLEIIPGGGESTPSRKPPLELIKGGLDEAIFLNPSGLIIKIDLEGMFNRTDFQTQSELIEIDLNDPEDVQVVKDVHGMLSSDMDITKEDLRERFGEKAE